MFQESAELRVIKLASEQNGSDRPTCMFHCLGGHRWHTELLREKKLSDLFALVLDTIRHLSFSGRKPLVG